jgi:outer membrane immunogenic protein
MIAGLSLCNHCGRQLLSRSVAERVQYVAANPIWEKSKGREGMEGIMKHVFIAGVAITAIIAGSAFAADMPLKAPPPPPPPLCLWCGFYIGVNAGYEFNSNQNVYTTARTSYAYPLAFGPNLAAAETTAANFNAGAGKNGFIGGGQIGYNFQLAPAWVAGIETDIQGLSGKGSTSLASAVAVTGVAPFVYTVNQAALVSGGVDYLGTLRARLGFLVTPAFMLYGTGGLAYGGVNSSTAIAQTLTGSINDLLPPHWATAGSSSDTRAGWTAGAGAEWMFAPRWTAKLEYLHYDLGFATYSVGTLLTNAIAHSPFTIVPVQATEKFSGDVIRVGVNYKFW